MSLTSSCEIVEALEDAVNDVNEVSEYVTNSENKESSPPVELSWIADSSMTASQYAQVRFNKFDGIDFCYFYLFFSQSTGPFVAS